MYLCVFSVQKHWSRSAVMVVVDRQSAAGLTSFRCALLQKPESKKGIFLDALVEEILDVSRFWQ